MNVRAILSIGAAMALPTAGRVLLAVIVVTAPVVAIAAKDEFALSTNFHRFLISRATAPAEAEMRVYTNTIPGTNVTYRMTPVRGGEFLLLC